MTAAPLTQEELRLLDAYWRAANYLSVGQIYLLDNPLLREPLRPEHVKPRLLGHLGTTPGLNLIYVHLNRVIRARDLRCDLRHRARATAGRASSPTRTSRARTPSSTRTSAPDEDGLRELFRQFSFPGGIPSHVAPETPGSIHEGGELGYALAHAYGAAFDNPDLVVCCVVGDGEAETGPLAASWHSNKFLNPATDGAVLPILHLNGYKIANPTVLARIPEDELVVAASRATGYRPLLVARRRPGARPPGASRPRSTTRSTRSRGSSARRARASATERPRWPMIVLRTPKGWTGPEGGRRQAGRGHVALAPGADRRRARQPGAPARCSRSGCAATGPRSSSTSDGRLVPELAALAPEGERRMGANPHANGGVLPRPRPARLPRLRGRGGGARHELERGDAGARRVPARRDRAQPGRTSASSAPTRPRPTASAPSSR